MTLTLQITFDVQQHTLQSPGSRPGTQQRCSCRTALRYVCLPWATLPLPGQGTTAHDTLSRFRRRWEQKKQPWYVVGSWWASANCPYRNRHPKDVSGAILAEDCNRASLPGYLRSVVQSHNNVQ